MMVLGLASSAHAGGLAFCDRLGICSVVKPIFDAIIILRAARQRRRRPLRGHSSLLAANERVEIFAEIKSSTADHH
jgi:hypothetical protein